MKAIKRFFSILYLIWVAIWFISGMLVTMPFIVIPVMISDRLGTVSFFFIRVWAIIFSIFTFIHFRAHGRAHIDRKVSYIFTSNHTSFLDAPAIPLAVPGQLRALGKKELSKIPVFGFITGRVAVWVDRSSEESRKKSIERLIKILNKGISIFMAPEGTRNEKNDTLLPFFNGPFRLAIETGTPIIPMIIHNAKRLMPRGTLMLKPGTIHTYFLAPIETKNLSEEDLPALKEKVFNLMKAKIEQLNLNQ